jgi:hypothetical protein
MARPKTKIDMADIPLPGNCMAEDDFAKALKRRGRGLSAPRCGKNSACSVFQAVQAHQAGVFRPKRDYGILRLGALTVLYNCADSSRVMNLRPIDRPT